jgi:hypothetical protein
VIPSLPTYLFTFSWSGVASLILTVILPLVAALLSKASWPGSVRGVVLLAVAAVKSVIEASIYSDNFQPGPTIYATVVNFTIAVVAYFGLLRGSGVQQAALTTLVK